MHHRELNRARFGLAFEPRGPMLIKSGLQTPDPTRPQLEFVRSRHARLGDTVYLPGSSLKGVMRSQGERSLAGLGMTQICSPVSRDGCGKKRQKDAAATSSAQCPICRVFGSLAQAGRLQIGDAFPWPLERAEIHQQREALEKANRTERRFQVGIDREGGGAQDSALFDLEVVVDGRFETVGHLRNFELWQLGLVAALVEDLNAGFCALGAGKSRGLGQMKAELLWLELEMGRPSDRRFSLQECLGLAGLLEAGDRRDFGSILAPSEDRAPLPTGWSWQPTWRGFRLEGRLEGPALAEFFYGVKGKPMEAFIERRGLPLERSHAH